MPAWEVHSVSHSADGMELFRAPSLVCASVSVPGWGGECVWQGGHGRRRQRELSISMWYGGSRKRTLGCRVL